MRSHINENVLEHTALVAQIAHGLAVIKNKFFGGNVNAERVAVIALYHDASEVITGDLPTPIKYFNMELNSAFKDLEDKASEKLLNMLPSELAQEYKDIMLPCTLSEEYKIVKSADKLSAYIKCIEEVNSGNKEFTKALKATETALKKSELPEVKYFLDNFIKGFTVTLDEMD